MKVLPFHLLMGIFQARDILWLDAKTQDVKHALDVFISINIYFHSTVIGKKSMFNPLCFNRDLSVVTTA